MDTATGRHRGFGFVRMANAEDQKKIFGMEHTICGRKCELRQPRKVRSNNLLQFTGSLFVTLLILKVSNIFNLCTFAYIRILH